MEQARIDREVFKTGAKISANKAPHKYEKRKSIHTHTTQNTEQEKVKRYLLEHSAPTGHFVYYTEFRCQRM